MRRHAAVLALAAAGCLGAIEGEDPDAPAPDEAAPTVNVPGGGAPLPPSADPARVGLTRARLWQIAPQQYQNTVEQALGAPVDLSSIAVTERHDGFLNPAQGGLDVTEVFFANLEEAVWRIAAEQTPRLAARLSCPLEALDRACLKGFVEPFGRLLFRTPEADFTPFLDLHATLAPKLGARGAFESVIAALLLSPKALFRLELGDRRQASPGPVRLTPGELAESLALTVSNRGPDDELLRLAADGRLQDPAVFRAQADRLLAGPRGNEGLHQLLAEWLGVATFDGVEKNPALFPMFDGPLKRALVDDSRRFVDHVLTARKGSFSDLLTLPSSFADRRMATIYGLPAPADQRGGAFTLPAVIAGMSEASLTGVIYRGKALLEKVLCMELRPPDMDVEFPDPEKLGLPKDATTRQRLESVEKQAACSACHLFLHPFSFPMESYDAIGRFRATENGRPIDGSGRIAYARTANAPYRNAVEMFRVLAGGEETRDCFVRQAFRYVYGRREEERDRPLLAEAFARFEESGLDVRGLYRALVLSEAFTHRERRSP